MESEINKERDGVDTDAVFIDSSTLSDLPAHLTQQELDTLVGLNIDALQVATSGHSMDAGHVMGPIIEDDDVDMHATDPLAVDPQHIDHLDSIEEQNQSMNELLQQHGEELIPITGTEEMLETSHVEDDFLTTSTQDTRAMTHQTFSHTNSVGAEAMGPQILKTSSGQFVILQPNNNQSTISVNPMRGGGLTGFSSSGQIVTSNNPKPIFVTNQQLSNASTIKQIPVSMNSPQTQFRTVQLKTPVSFAQNSTRPVTKLILSSQPMGSNNLSQQLRLITSNNNNSNNHIFTTAGNQQQKIALQLQPIGGQQAKNIVRTSPIKMLSTSDYSSANKMKSPQKIIISSKVQNPNSISMSNLKPGQFLTTSSGGGTTTQLIKIPVSQLSQLTNQTVQFANNKVPMNLRILSSSSSLSNTTQSGLINTSNMGGQTIIKSVNLGKTVIPNHRIVGAQTRTITIPSNNQTFTINQEGKTRFLVPTSNATIPISTSQQPRHTSIEMRPPGLPSTVQPGSLFVIPAQYLPGLSGTGNSQQVLQMSNQNATAVAISPGPKPPKTLIDANGIKPRKPCNCTKSQCLKLYCDCFANGEFCNNCNCANCYNNLTHENDRQKAIRACLERNPYAFRPKIGKGGTDTERRHNKGCNCKRSGCLKNYCECFEAKIACSNMCKCIGCRNIECQPHFGMDLQKQVLGAFTEDGYLHSDVKPLINKGSRPLSLSHLPSPAKMSMALTNKNICCHINQEVVEATTYCLLAHAEKAETAGSSIAEMEFIVIDEFSRCLKQIIGIQSKVKGPVD